MGQPPVDSVHIVGRDSHRTTLSTPRGFGEAGSMAQSRFDTQQQPALTEVLLFSPWRRASSWFAARAAMEVSMSTDHYDSRGIKHQAPPWRAYGTQLTNKSGSPSKRV